MGAIEFNFVTIMKGKPVFLKIISKWYYRPIVPGGAISTRGHIPKFSDFPTALVLVVNVSSILKPCASKFLSEALIFLHQLTHNMTTDCSLDYNFNTLKVQAQTWGEHVVSDIQNNFCTQHVLPMLCKKKTF